jgi:hypothetical protein
MLGGARHVPYGFRLQAELGYTPLYIRYNQRGQRLRFPIEHYSHVGGTNHFELLNHPAIYRQIRRWMAPRRALPAPQPSERQAS